MPLDNLQPLEDFLKFKTTFIMSIWGQPKVGKSFFTFTAPKPLYHLSFEPEGPYWAIRNAHKLGYIQNGDAEFDDIIPNALNGNVPPVRTEGEDITVYRYFQEQIQDIIKEGKDKGGTGIIDTATTLWDVCQTAEMEEINKRRRKQEKDNMPQDWRPANRAMTQLMDSLAGSGMNWILVHRGTEDWGIKEGKGLGPLGTWSIQGNNKLPYLVDVQFRIGPGRTQTKRSQKVNKETRSLTIEHCRIDNALEGEVLENPDWDTLVDFLLHPEEFEVGG